MTKRWSSTVSDLTKTKRQASREARRADEAIKRDAVTEMQVTSDDLVDVIAARDFAQDEIVRVFRIPAHMMGNPTPFRRVRT